MDVFFFWSLRQIEILAFLKKKKKEIASIICLWSSRIFLFPRSLCCFCVPCSYLTYKRHSRVCNTLSAIDKWMPIFVRNQVKRIFVCLYQNCNSWAARLSPCFSTRLFLIRKMVREEKEEKVIKFVMCRIFIEGKKTKDGWVLHSNHLTERFSLSSAVDYSIFFFHAIVLSSLPPPPFFRKNEKKKKEHRKDREGISSVTQISSNLSVTIQYMDTKIDFSGGGKERKKMNTEVLIPSDILQEINYFEK